MGLFLSQIVKTLTSILSLTHIAIKHGVKVLEKIWNCQVLYNSTTNWLFISSETPLDRIWRTRMRKTEETNQIIVCFLNWSLICIVNSPSRKYSSLLFYLEQRFFSSCCSFVCFSVCFLVCFQVLFNAKNNQFFMQTAFIYVNSIYKYTTLPSSHWF